MDDRLLDQIATRLEQADLDDDAGLLVLAACESDAALAEAVAGAVPELSAVATGDAVPAEPAGAYLSSVTAEGFRGIGEARTIELTPGPGLTLVVGRNGSGKSSFVEALEMLLTGDSRRWSGRNDKTWSGGWRNLHQPSSTRLSATLALDGVAKPTTVTREWQEGAELSDCSAYAQTQGAPQTALEALGWESALATARPLLSYNELGSVLDEGPTRLFDAISGILGLDDATEAVERLRQTRLGLTKIADASRKDAKALQRDLEELDDQRAQECATALAAISPDVDRIAAIVTASTAVASPGGDLELLRSLAALAGPDAERVAVAVERAREAANEADAIAGTDAETAALTAGLLEAALEHHAHVGDEPCPVCGEGRLNETWKNATAVEIERLSRVASAARHADQSVASVRQRLASIQMLPQVSLPEATRLGLDANAVRECWERWLSVETADLRTAASAFESLLPEFTASVAALRESAATTLSEREDQWQPMAERIAAWLEQARRTEVAKRALPNVKVAEDWLADALAAMRNERLEPIATHAANVWRALNQHSNVELGTITLTGKGTSRRANLDVAVDGVESVALSVMSQGELHALALALFLPRATQPQSPFRFVVIDDPVQAMDPAKVDGLARVLEDTARTRQVVVFTHDDRLPESIRRLGIDATVWAVTRRDGSQVDLRRVRDPAATYIDDARAIAITSDLSDETKRRVIPGYCRHAIEATLNEVIRRKLLGAGTPHGEVEERIDAVTTMTMRAALALFGDEQKGGDVLARLNTYGRWAGDAYQACNKGSHDLYPGDLRALVNDTVRVVEKLRTAS